ncbi:FAD-dependent oxidoreductase [Tepidanaerobacter syntrophicus]|uniref:oxidoreductase n=1 Tax=Tepidanaerobacter syntrophicus TaxID=224999 RepID=UPI001BD64CA6|nr:FAD-dependent oxidoreductase [Tepidanaerobacter syntrophicus]
MSKFPLLFTPLKVGKTTFRNRIMSTPTSLTWADYTGAPNDATVFYYEEKARGGACSVTLSETTISRTSRASRGVNHYILPDPQYGDPGPQLTKVVEAIKRHGAIASVQIHHAGDVTHPSLIGGLDPFGPNDYIRPDGVHVKGMDEDDMYMVAEDFAKAAARAKALGFGMVMIHGAHGWLLGQFQSAATNWRKDKYGGSIENRARFPLMVVKAVREAVGPDFPIEYRVSGDEHLKGGVVKEEAAEFCSILQDYVSIFHVSAGSYYTAREYTFPGSYQPHDTNTHLAEAVKKKVHVPVATVGAHMDPFIMEQILEEGKADFIAIGRGIICDPQLPNKIFDNELDDIRPCLRCNNCLGRKYECFNNCDVNPLAGNEFWTLNTPPVKISRKVLVIGGGPGGMQAAITASERGHKVKLVEKSNSLGGNLKFADMDEHKVDLKRYKDYLIHQVNKHAVDVRLNTKATKALIEEEKPYAVIIAIGAEPIKPTFPGMNKLPCIHATEAYMHPEKVGNKVVIIGGGLVGCEVGIYLSSKGRDVTLIEMQNMLAPDANIIHRDSMMEVFEPAVKYRLNTKCTAITEKGVKAINDKGEEELFEADTVVYAVGMKPNDEEAWSFKEAKNVSRFFVIGDCVTPTRIKDATHGGYHAAIDII